VGGGCGEVSGRKNLVYREMAVYIPVPSLDRGECETEVGGENAFPNMVDACLHSESEYILKVTVYDHEHTRENSIKQYYGEWETEISRLAEKP